jgi:hypothetical protein
LVLELKTLYNDLHLEDVRVFRPSKFLFFCGGYIAPVGAERPANLRDYLFRVRRINRRYNIILAEEATQLYRDSHYGDLISFEEDLARIASVVLVIAESPGSLAELGAFTANPTILKALRVIIQHHHEVEESFIRYGPVERIKKAKRANLAAYPWRIHRNNGFLNISSARPHYSEIIKFLDEHINSVTDSTTYPKLGEAELFYVIYWIVHLCLAVTPSTLYQYVRSIFIEATDEEIRNKLYCMQLAGWIARYTYSNRDYIYALHDDDPFEYTFKPGVADRISIRRKLAVTTALQQAETLPSHIRSRAAAARVAKIS